MTRKIFVIILSFASILYSCVEGRAFLYDTINFVENDIRLPFYDNITELDVNNNLHMSLKGVFRQRDDKNNPTDWIAFVFVADARRDTTLKIDQTELVDGEGEIFRIGGISWIGRDLTWSREIVADIPVRVCVWFKVPVNLSREFPTVGRVSILFNGRGFEFRNIITQDADKWSELAQRLKLSESIYMP